jgi:hypothetical protein
LSVWFVIPSKRPPAEASECFAAWHRLGYRTAALREEADGKPGMVDFCCPTQSYLGWSRSVNLLVASVMAYDPHAEWFVTGGDDYFPDPNHTADEIAYACSYHFEQERLKATGGDSTLIAFHGTFGVMQPTGDRWMERNGEAVIDRIAGSPWMGREFCWRMYHGAGPLYNGYYHNFADEELQCVAQKLGVFWQRRDLMQEHRHWARPRGDWRDAPEWAKKINDPAFSDWDKSKALFAKRKAAGFPGSEPLEI